MSCWVMDVAMQLRALSNLMQHLAMREMMPMQGEEPYDKEGIDSDRQKIGKAGNFFPVERVSLRITNSLSEPEILEGDKKKALIKLAKRG